VFPSTLLVFGLKIKDKVDFISSHAKNKEKLNQVGRMPMEGTIHKISKHIELWGLIFVDGEPNHFYFSPHNVVGGMEEFLKLVVNDKVSFVTDGEYIGAIYMRALKVQKIA
jgi:hypothetical protein